jgi:parvulin-like peptidyl-prolyl isomerase
MKKILIIMGVSLIPLTQVSAKELAKVNDVSISDRDLTLSLSSLNEGQKGSVLKDSNSRKQILQDVIDRELVAQDGEKMKLDQETEFKELMVLYKKQFLASRVLEKMVGPKLTPATVKKYYESHKYQFSPDQARVQHILVADEGEATKMLQLAKDPKNDFQDLAEKHSKDPSAKNNRGDLGFVPRGQFVPEFTEAMFSIPEGEIGGPVKTAFGYHIIKVIQKKMAKPLEFHEVELQAREALKQELIRNYVNDLKKQAKIKIDRAAVDKL